MPFPPPIDCCFQTLAHYGACQSVSPHCPPHRAATPSPFTAPFSSPPSPTQDYNFRDCDVRCPDGAARRVRWLRVAEAGARGQGGAGPPVFEA